MPGYETPRASRSDSPGFLLALIREMGGATRKELQQATHLARATLESRLDRLEAQGYIVPRGAPSAAGRPPQVFHFNAAGGYLICIDMDVSSTRLGITDLDANLIAHRSVELDLGMGPGVALGKLGTILRDMIRHARIEPKVVMGVGVGVPSHVLVSGRMARPPFRGPASLPWTDMIVSEEIQAFLPALGIGAVPVLVDNGANTMALGVWRTSWPEVRDMIVLRVDMSTSFGIVANSEIVRGAIGLAGDLGHIPNQDSEIACTCGQRGCTVAIASGRGIAGSLGTTVEPPIRTSEDLLRLLRSGRDDVAELTKRAGRLLGVLVGDTIATLNPQIVVVGGGLVQDDTVLLDELRAVVPSRIHPIAASTTSIVATPISEEGGLYGAAHLALRHTLSPAYVDRAIGQGVSLAVRT
ncbi:MAG: ROK family transcriptional regulator [Candidatus Nanopelagicales bacterium]|nr:ROK family transcriptional regulator [Candidatus Nanopelagicales bacterium]